MGTTLETHPSIEEIHGVVTSVGDLALGATVEQDVACAWRNGPGVWAGCVSISGAWHGSVVLTCTVDFARGAASHMFQVPIEDTEEEAAREALAEVVNMVGGNIKALYSALAGSTCRLSLPIVAAGVIRIPDATIVRDVCFSGAGHAFAVTIYDVPPDALLPLE
ncbi:MAG: chemotaxis protein CheX [Gemmatimonadetes bacterium]|nr:chemotaxis protein CheX [Gemmatimonadota bacterium]